MYRSDYLMRYLLTFLEKIAELLSKKSFQVTDVETVANFYKDIFQEDRVNLIHKNEEELILHPDEEGHIEKMRLLAELFHLESKMCPEDQAKEFLQKSLFLFEYVNCKGDTYDFELQGKIAAIKSQLKEEN